MRLWHVYRDGCGYDEYDAFVIWAADEAQALSLAIARERAIASEEWTVEEIVSDGTPGIVLGSFNAG